MQIGNSVPTPGPGPVPCLGLIFYACTCGVFVLWVAGTESTLMLQFISLFTWGFVSFRSLVIQWRFVNRVQKQMNAFLEVRLFSFFLLQKEGFLK